jgi:type I restriction enzyme M protein
MTFLERAKTDGLIRFTGEGRSERIHYVAVKHSERWSDPEEKARAEFWAKLHYHYNYKPELIGFEVPVPRRTPEDKADLVLYRDAELKRPFAVIECKRDGITDAEFAQAIEQACGNRASLGAIYSGVVAGITARFLDFDSDRFPPGERQKNIIADLPKNYGKPPAWRFIKKSTSKTPSVAEGDITTEPPGDDLGAVPREDLRTVIRKCHQTLWEGGKRSPIAAFGEFCKIIFVKIWDEKDTRPGQPYQFQRHTDETVEDLAARIARLYATHAAREPGVFVDKINVDPPVLAQVVDHISAVNFSKTDLDTKGVAFEEFLGSFFKGDFGQYFTPRELIAFCVHLLAPEKAHLILDPACGSGGFLLHALDFMRKEADHQFPDFLTDRDQALDHFRFWHDFAEQQLFGIEINDELTRVAKMNMIIHDDGHTNIAGHDALDFFEQPRNAEGKPKGPERKYLSDENEDFRPGRFDLVLTNPPFGSVVKALEKDEGYLEQFELRRYLSKSTTDTKADPGTGEGDAKRGAKTVKLRTSIKTEILFLERIHSFLRPGDGRAAVIVPDGVLTNSSLQGVRDWLLEKFEILAVVSLPQLAFQHYDAGVKASILFVRRLADGEKVAEDRPVFMALAENIGYDATGRKAFTVVQSEGSVEGGEKVDVLRCDLFDYSVTYDWSDSAAKSKPGWVERHREVIPDTGLVAQYRSFRRDPEPFFV